MSNYLLIDGNSIGNAANNTKPLQIGDLQVQAIFIFLKMIRKQISTYQNYEPIVLWDGASWRYQMFPDYKSDREKLNTKHEKEAADRKVHYKRQVPHIRKALQLLGVKQIHALNMEADDFGAMMVDLAKRKSGRAILLTGDKDWIQLVEHGVIWKDPIKDRTVTIQNFEEFTGVKTPQQFIELKALMGDGGDSIPGVGGIGDKGAIEFLNTYGSFNNFLNMVTLEKTVDIKTLPKKFRDLIEDESKAMTFDRNLKLMDLRHPQRPKPLNTSIDKGEPDLAKFKRFCELLMFKSILDTLPTWASVFPPFREA